jgi:uncharacterized protein YqeY
MSLHEQIKNNIKESMKAGDKVRLEVMRGLVTAFTNELVATGRTPQDILTDEEVIKVITRASKQRKDSIEQFTKGNRMDLVEIENAQLAILIPYLPKLFDKDETEKLVRDYKMHLGIKDQDVHQKGYLISYVMKELKGQVDGAIVKEIVDKLFV